MREDEKALTWFYAHCFEGSSKTEMDRLFQRVNFFLIGMGFLLTALASLVLSCKVMTPSTWPFMLGTALIIAGFLISAGFWVINCWNITLIMRRERGVWRQLKRLKSDHTSVKYELDRFIRNSLVESRDTNRGRILFSFVWHPLDIRVPAWHTRGLPVFFFVVWLTLGLWLWIPGFWIGTAVSILVLVIWCALLVHVYRRKEDIVRCSKVSKLYDECIFPNRKERLCL